MSQLLKDFVRQLREEAAYTGDPAASNVADTVGGAITSILAEVSQLRTTLAMRPMTEDDREKFLSNEDRSWMTLEDYSAHYEGSMLNWNIVLDERDELKQQVENLTSEVACLKSEVYWFDS